VSGCVGERFLDNPVRGHADLGWQQSSVALLGELDGQAGRAGSGDEVR
jgi:hypothetical protein